MVPAGGWQETALWTELHGREDEVAENLKRALAGILPEVEVILRSGGTTPPQYTLHDSEHSWRVAQWMADLVGPDLLTELGPYDLGMLLLSAYLHDIGMTPPLARVDAHLALLLVGDASLIEHGDAELLQEWLDDEWDGMVPPLADGTPTPEDLRRVRQVLGGYVRHRHNEWSEEWMRKHLSSRVESLYPAWLDDLVRLCKSHHYGIDQLRAAEFNPRLVGAPATVLHLRYCACLLRVADLLDFDPERTPPILFEHRDIEGPSAIFWHKDHELAFTHEDAHIAIHAQPADALTHHAIDETVRELDSELLVCRRLDDETDFGRLVGRDSPPPHRWNLDTNVRAVITARDGAYEYVDGTFRPDSKKLLNLVAGVELYGSAFAAVREVLQNAFDAVREQIAHERLRLQDPSDETEAERLARGLSVELLLQLDGDELTLICRDTGTGMSREVIVNRFLVGGTKPRHDNLQLERACQEHGFSVGRTARFGIGVLSYFLLASYLRLRTRRSIEAEDSDGTGWIFSTYGLTDFGELKRDLQPVVGTEVELQILPEHVRGNPEMFAQELVRYLRATLKRVPCKFSFEAPELGVSGIAWDPGWIDRDEAVRDSFLNGMMERSPKALETMPTQKRELIEREAARWEEARGRAEQALRVEVLEGPLPGGLGRFRIFVAYFELSVGRSLAFLDLERSGEETIVRDIGGADAIFISSHGSMSWNGMTIHEQTDDLDEWGDVYFPSHSELPRNVIVDVDWISDAAGRLAVHRNSMDTSEAAHDAGEYAIERAREFLSDLVRESRDSPVGLINARAAGALPDPVEANPWWIQNDGDSGQSVLAPIRFPAIMLRPETPEESWRGLLTDRVPALKVREEGYNAKPVTWHGGLVRPQNIGWSAATRQPTFIWEAMEPTGYAGRRRQTCFSQFPPEWNAFLSLKLWGYPLTILNESHPLIMAASPAAEEWVRETFRKEVDPLPHRASMSGDRLAAWILHCIDWDQEDLWNGLHERCTSFLLEAWAKIDGLSKLGAVIFWRDEGTSRLNILTPEKWEKHKLDEGSDLLQFLAQPGPNWTLTATEEHRHGGEPT